MMILRTTVFALLCAGSILAQAPAKPQGAQPKAAAKEPASKSDTQAAEQEAPIPPETPGSLFPSVVARVNSRPILGRDAERRIQAQLLPLGNPEWKNLKEEYREELINQALASLIAAELIYQKAVAAGMKATEAEVQAEFAKTAKNFASDAEMNIALANRGFDRAAYTKELARSMTVEKYVNETIGKKIAVNPTELTQYYNEHKTDFKHPDLVRTSHILILVPESATAEQDKLAMQRAASLLQRVRKGEDFAKLAKEYSMDNSASNGGDIGLMPKDSLAPEYGSVAFSLPVGGISEVVRTQFGYHIIKVTEKKKEGITDLEEIRPALGDFLKSQRINAELNKVVSSERAAAKVEVLIKLATPLNFGNATVSSPRP